MKMKELFDLMQTATTDQNDQALAVFDTLLHEIKNKYPEAYENYETKLTEIYHNSLDEEEAKHFVSLFHNLDGTKGAHYTEEQVHQAIKECPELHNYPFWDVYYVMNMMYSDYFDRTFVPLMYRKLALKFLSDQDGAVSKTKKYAEAMHH